MGLILNGNAPSKMLYNGAEVSLYFNGSKIWPVSLGPIPSNTVRVRTNDGNAPVKGTNTSYETATLVPGTVDVYDVYKSGDSFRNLLTESTNVIEVLGANSTGIKSTYGMFYKCTSLTSIPLFDTSIVTSMAYMCNGCTSLTAVPLFNTSSVVTMWAMFYNCYKVQSGALALYQQASTQATPPNEHTYAFTNCGRDTVTGAAELAQIPSDWK